MNERIYIYPNDKRVFLDAYICSEAAAAVSDAILILPGGGYSMTCSDREGEFIAHAYVKEGISAFALTYNTDADSVFPSQLRDASLAFKYIKENADKYHIDPKRIFIIGFSAGGHLAGSLSLHHKYMESLLSLPENYLKPRGTILSYPVVTLRSPYAHRGSFESLLKKSYSEITDAEKQFHSLECNVAADTPPAFIWHTAADALVPVGNSLMLAEAYAEAGVSFELHIYPEGPHGAGLATEAASMGIKEIVLPDAAKWHGLSSRWIKKQKD